MSDPCKRCGDPSGDHELGGEGTASERNCNLYRIGTQLERIKMLLAILGFIGWLTFVYVVTH